ncbi:MAG: ImmA/IrrE family metallo-endopeptidase [Burkholderiaceae bacterium]|nr:ImmA/IrrE family metallo-endopeptidase [Burkholderiaceae bacterium]
MAMFAEGILKLHWDQSVPVNLARIARSMGVAVRLSDTLQACAQLDISLQNQAVITLGKEQSIVRQRYGVAHALGHVALHHLRPGHQRLIDVSDNFGVDAHQRSETEANQFALALLMPSDALRQRVQELRMADLDDLARLFEVSSILVKQRMADLSLHFNRPLALQRDPWHWSDED